MIPILHKIKILKARTGLLTKASIFDIFLFAKLYVRGLCLSYLLFTCSDLLSSWAVSGLSADSLSIVLCIPKMLFFYVL